MTRPSGLKTVIFDAWPEQDRAAWENARISGGVFGASGALAHRSSKDLKRYSQAYGTWLAFLMERNEGHVPPSCVDQFREEEVRAFLELLATRLAPCSILSFLVSLRAVARALSKSASFPMLDLAIRHYKRTAKPASDKLSRMRNIMEVQELGRHLMAQPQRATAAMRHANQYRDGLAIAMLTVEPLRIGNFGSLQLDHSIRRLSDRYTIHIATSKNGDAIMFDLPIWLTQPIDVYLEQYRPYLLTRRGRWWSSAPSNAFWVSSNGTAMTARQLSKRMVDRTREAFGRPVNPHLFRDIVATTIATEDPEHVHMILPILSHRSLKTSEKHYNHAKSLDASRRYQDVLQDFMRPVGG